MSKKAPQTPIRNFRFKKHANIGAADASEDKNFLDPCFIDTGEMDILRDNDRTECIILGRTGLGKTALLQQLASLEERVIKIAPPKVWP